MSVTQVRTSAEFEAELQRYLYERSEEGRAVRVGEKETSEQAAIVARYANLFSRAQIEALRDEEQQASSATSANACTACARPASPGSSPRSSRSVRMRSRTRCSAHG